MTAFLLYLFAVSVTTPVGNNDIDHLNTVLNITEEHKYEGDDSMKSDNEPATINIKSIDTANEKIKAQSTGRDYQQINVTQMPREIKKEAKCANLINTKSVTEPSISGIKGKYIAREDLPAPPPTPKKLIRFLDKKPDAISQSYVNKKTLGSTNEEDLRPIENISAAEGQLAGKGAIENADCANDTDSLQSTMVRILLSHNQSSIKKASSTPLTRLNSPFIEQKKDKPSILASMKNFVQQGCLKTGHAFCTIKSSAIAVKERLYSVLSKSTNFVSNSDAPFLSKRFRQSTTKFKRALSKPTYEDNRSRLVKRKITVDQICRVWDEIPVKNGTQMRLSEVYESESDSFDSSSDFDECYEIGETVAETSLANHGCIMTVDTIESSNGVEENQISYSLSQKQDENPNKYSNRIYANEKDNLSRLSTISEKSEVGEQ